MSPISSQGSVQTLCCYLSSYQRRHNHQNCQVRTPQRLPSRLLATRGMVLRVTRMRIHTSAYYSFRRICTHYSQRNSGIMCASLSADVLGKVESQIFQKRPHLHWPISSFLYKEVRRAQWPFQYTHSERPALEYESCIERLIACEFTSLKVVFPINPLWWYSNYLVPQEALSCVTQETGNQCLVAKLYQVLCKLHALIQLQLGFIQINPSQLGSQAYKPQWVPFILWLPMVQVYIHYWSGENIGRGN